MSKKSKRSSKLSSQQRLSWRWLAVITIGVLVLGALAAIWTSSSSNPAVTPAVTGSPRLAVDPTIVDEGYVKLNTPIRSQFRLRNVGDQSLSILKEPQVEIVEGC